MIHSATLLTYLPRGSTYFVLNHDVDIKSDDDTWVKGCVYQCLSTKQVYVRPYDLFCVDNWKYT